MVLTAVIRKRFWRYVLVIGSNDCWEWKGSLQSRGYGQMWDGQRLQLAHRLVISVILSKEMF